MEPVTAAMLIGSAAASVGAGAAAAGRKGFRPGFQWGQSGERAVDTNGQLMDDYVDGYNPNKYEYGGRKGTANATYDAYQDRARQAGDRAGAQADYTMANLDRANAAQARAQQAQALDLQRQAALGQAPSVAQLQMVAGMDQAMRGQEAQRASARGAAGVAMADYGAAANIAATQQATNQQMGILRAQEMATARDAYMQGATGIRGMDYQAAQQAAQMSQFQTEQEMRQREMNDRYQMGAFGLAEGVRSLQMQGNLQNQSAMLNAYLENKRLAQAAAAGQAAQTMQGIQMGVGGAAGAMNAWAAAYGGEKK